MQLRFVILSVACFACLIPTAVSLNLLAAKEVASQAAQDVVSIGAETVAAKKAAVTKAASDIASIAAQGVVLKGQALKTAAASIAGAVIDGAISIGATIAKAGLNMIAAKFSGKPTLTYEPSSIVIETPVLQDTIVKETVVQEPVLVEYDQAVEVPVQIPAISSVSVDVSPEVWDVAAPQQLSQSVFTVNEAAPSFEIVRPANSPYVYEIDQAPQKYGPLMETFHFGKK